MILDPYATAVLATRGLVGYWRLGEASGTAAADASGNGHDGVYSGGVTLGETGALADGDTAVSFDGVDGLVTNAAAALKLTGGPLSVEIWAKQAASSIDAGLIGTGASGFTGYQLNWHVGSSIFFYTGGSQTTTALSDSADFHHIVGTWDGTTGANGIKLYIDGVLKAQATATTPTLSNTTFQIGRSTTYFAGTLAEAAVYSRALTADEVAAHYAGRTLGHGEQALMYARAGLARSGATRSDYYNEVLALTIAGVDQAAKVWKGTTVIRKALNEQPDSATFRTFGITPVGGQDVVIGSGAINNRQFGGVILRATKVPVKSIASTPSATIHDVECADWSFILARKRVQRRYVSTAAHLIFLDLAEDYAPGFTVTGVQTGSPTIDEIEFDRQTTLPAAFTRLGNRCDPPWRWYAGAEKNLHFFETETSQAPRDITPTNLRFEGLSYESFIGQIRTRVLVEGGGGVTTDGVAAGATSIPVDECSWYSATGGSVTSGPQTITYTGRSATSGPGNLTGVPATGTGAVQYALTQGQTVNLLVTVDDTDAQTALAALSDSFGDGVYEYFVRDNRLSETGATERGTAELRLFSAALEAGGYVTRDKFADVGKSVTIALPGRDINLTAAINEVELRWVAHQKMERRARFDSSVRIDLTDVVRSLAGGAR